MVVVQYPSQMHACCQRPFHFLLFFFTVPFVLVVVIEQVWQAYSTNNERITRALAHLLENPAGLRKVSHDTMNRWR